MSLARRVSISAERRSIVRRAIGEDTLGRAAAMTDCTLHEEISDEELIALHESGLFEDLKHDWLAGPILRLFDATTAVACFDIENDTTVGQELRREASGLVADGETVAELIAFVDLFRPNILLDLVRSAAVHGLLTARALLEWMAAETDEESADRAMLFDMFSNDLSQHRSTLHALPRLPPELLSISPGSYEEEFEVLVGVPWPTSPPSRWPDFCRLLEKKGHDLCQLGAQQLRYLGPYTATDPIWARNYLELALRIGRSAYPLLAHRAAYLTNDLLDRAAASDTVASNRTLRTFFDQESNWMIDAHVKYRAARDRYLDGDQSAIIEAYRVLAEGTLRRYASLILALEDIAAHRPTPHPLILNTIGDVETRLESLTPKPLPSLILRFVERKLRNADAHANVFVGNDGDLRVKLRDGSRESLHANTIYGKTAGMRSLLDGVDIAANLVSIRNNEAEIAAGRRPLRPEMSEHVLGRTINHLAEEHTRGSVTDVMVREGILTMRFWGEATYEELLGLVNRLIPILAPDLPLIRIADEQGQPLAEFQPPGQPA